MSLESDHGIQHGHDLEQPHAAATSSLFHDDEALDVSEEDKDEDRIPRDLVGSVGGERFLRRPPRPRPVLLSVAAELY